MRYQKPTVRLMVLLVIVCAGSLVVQYFLRPLDISSFFARPFADRAYSPLTSFPPPQEEMQEKPLELPPCPERPVIHEQKVPLKTTATTAEEVSKELRPFLEPGGRHVTSACRARENVALIIPYRDRRENLIVLLRNLVPFLVRQQLDFTVFLVEQTKDYDFNRCLLFNVGFVESQKRGNFTCFILHDVDILPRDYRNLYRCDENPRHLGQSRSNETWKQGLPYPLYFGGAIALRKEHMYKSNGCSNYYYGWGVEDDDLLKRLTNVGLRIGRYSANIGDYYILGHKVAEYGPHRKQLIATIQSRQKTEGLNSLHYTILNCTYFPLYTWLLVKPPAPPHDIYTEYKARRKMLRGRGAH